MGIQGLSKVIGDYAPSAVKENEIKNYFGMFFSFLPATISSWNNLPFGIEKVDSVEDFKLKLKEHTFRSP